LICIAGGLLLTQAGTAQAMYWGATIDGDVYGQATDAPWNQTVWNDFEKDAGRKVTMVQMAQQWGKFDTAAFQAVRNRGAIPLVSTGLPQGVTLADVANGSQDAVINAWAKQAKTWGYPFLFRPWWEMNGDWYSWGRDPNFIAAWRHFHDLVVADGATNVTWAWVINGLRYAPMEPAPYYPGGAYVDWVGVDTYNWGVNPLQPDYWQTPDQTLTSNVNRLKQIAPGKPICICEIASTEIGGDKAQWIKDLLGTYLPRHPDIKAFLWMNWNVPQNGGRWDWQIESSDSSQIAFRRGIRSSIYRSTLPPLTPLTKLPVP
jgi:Glycosyl hydrolase family 26